jgi:hypothetical protein
MLIEYCYMNIILNGSYEPLDKDRMMIMQWLLTEPRGEEEGEGEITNISN